MELEGRINYLQGHIEELKVENKQLERDISQTKVENVILRDNLHTARRSMEPRHQDMSSSPPLQLPAVDPIQSSPILLKDLLMLYGPHADGDYP